MQKWEYFAYGRNLVEKKGNILNSSEWVWDAPPDFNKLGMQGWELVSVISVQQGMRNMPPGITTQMNYYFKRPIE
jgi:hypothetical protein